MTARIAHMIGFALLAAVFLFAGWRLVGPSAPLPNRAPDERTVVRFAHFQLEGGLREAFDAVLADYARLRPDVLVEQMAVPERTWSAWMRTQLVGGTPPDLVQFPAPDDLQARYFTALTPWIKQPNPYNAGTPLEGLPWRDTFIDGLTNPPAYNPNLLEFFAIPIASSTIRLAYNADLLHEINGTGELPATYTAFVELLQATLDHAAERRRPIVPIAGSGVNTAALLIRLFGTQTQRLGLELDPLYTLNVTTRESAPAFLRGVWSLDNPAIHDGVALWHELAPFIQPGFLQLRREDAQFYFSQRRALFIGVTSRDINSVVDESDFNVGIFDIPQPDHHPRYGRHILGRTSESDKPLSTAFGLTRASRHPAAAIDFLHFLSSHPGATRFAQASNWMSATVGVAPNPAAAGFLPVAEGVTSGFGIHFTGYGASRTRQLYDSSLHRLFGPGGSPDAFIEALRATYAQTLAADIAYLARTTRNNIRRADSAHAAYHRLATVDPAQAERLSLLTETQNGLETEAAMLQSSLARAR